MPLTVDELLQLKESNQVELKESKTKIPLSFYETYSAMANGSGGYIYLGITEGEPENTICGVENALQKKKLLFATLTNTSKIANASPRPNDITVIPTEFGDVIEVKVNPAPIDDRPVYLDSNPMRSFKRVDEGDKLLSKEEIMGMVNDARKTKFDQRQNEYGLELSDLDPDAVREYCIWARREGKIPLAESMSDEEILGRIGAITIDQETKKSSITNGAALFFGKTYVISSIAPSLWLDYQEKNPSAERFTHRITNRDLVTEANIFQFYSRAMNRLDETLPAPFYLEKGMNVGKRVIREVVREALANAISNLELSSQLGLRIERWPSLIKFQNAGGVLTGIPQALKGGVSVPRNPCIFNFFLALGITDHGGYGIPSIFDRMRQLGMVEPELSETPQRDQTTLVLSFASSSTEITQEEEKIITFLSMRPSGASSLDIANYLGCSQETVRKLLQKLMQAGLVADNGKTTRGRLYYIKS